MIVQNVNFVQSEELRSPVEKSATWIGTSAMGSLEKVCAYVGISVFNRALQSRLLWMQRGQSVSAKKNWVAFRSSLTNSGKSIELCSELRFDDKLCVWRYIDLSTGQFIPFLSPEDYEKYPLLHFFDVKEDF